MGKLKENNFQKPGEELLLTYIEGKASHDEGRIIELWLEQDQNNEKILLQIASLYFALHRQQRIEKRNSLQAFEKVHHRIRFRVRKKWMIRSTVAAAGISIIFLLSTLISFWRQTPIEEKVQLVAVQANSGTQSHFNLPDGTLVYLNSGSKITYPISFDKKQRDVTLMGEAWFNVTHNGESPFIVHVFNDSMQVKVTGTEFNVQAFPDDDYAVTTLVSGSVHVNYFDHEGKVKQIDMNPSERVTYRLDNGNIDIAKVNTQYETSWKEGKLMFKNMPLPKVLKKLSYLYNVRFEVKSSVINDYRLTGIFENRQLSQVLDYLKISSGIKYSINYSKEDDSNGIKTNYCDFILNGQKTYGKTLETSFRMQTLDYQIDKMVLLNSFTKVK